MYSKGWVAWLKSLSLKDVLWWRAESGAVGPSRSSYFKEEPVRQASPVEVPSAKEGSYAG